MCEPQATVGAGLPIISTLQALLMTGDRVHKIEGVFSGSLSYIFNTFSSTASFSTVVSEARTRGFTEPDPREDLSGMPQNVAGTPACGMPVSNYV